MRSFSLLLAVGLSLLVNHGLHAQSFLERLEQSLRGAAGAQGAAAANDVEAAGANGGAPVDAAAESTGDGSAMSPGYLGLTGDESGGAGVVVLSIRSGSPAETAGFREGDVITAMDGVAVSTLDDLGDRLARLKSGTQINFEILRKGDRRLLKTTLGDFPAGAAGTPLPDANAAVPGATAPGSATHGTLPTPRAEFAPGLSANSQRYPLRAEDERPSLGVTVVDLTEALRRQYGAAVSRGALVTAVHPGTPAERYEIPVGAVIVAADGLRVNGYDDLVRYLLTRRSGDSVELTYYYRTNLTRRVVRLSGEREATALEERLRVSPDAAARPSPFADSDRPAARVLGRVLEGLAGAAPPADTPAYGPSSADYYEMRRQMQLMQAHIEDLEERLAELELKLAAPAQP